MCNATPATVLNFSVGETGMQIAQQNIILDSGLNRDEVHGGPESYFSGFGLENFFWYDNIEQ
jgi:hypothetical protein